MTSKVGQLTNKPVYKVPEPSKELSLSYGKVGIEIEVERCKEGAQAAILRLGKWNAHRDHSLRNDGMEFTTVGNGVVGKDIIVAVEEFCTWAINNDVDVGYPRAGIHIHLDVTDLDVEKGELYTLVGAYALVEQALFGWAGEWRKWCGFCDTLLSNGKNRNYLRVLLTNRGIAAPSFVANVNALHRYVGFNLAALGRFGTVEFRHLPTTFDGKRIITWINMIFQLKKFALKYNSNLDFHEYAMGKSPEEVAAEVMGPMWNELRPYFDRKAAAKDMEAFALLCDRRKTNKVEFPSGEIAPNPYLKNKMCNGDASKDKEKSPYVQFRRLVRPLQEGRRDFNAAMAAEIPERIARNGRRQERVVIMGPDTVEDI